MEDFIRRNKGYFLTAAAFILVTIGYPILVDQAYLRYEPHVLPAIVVSAAIFVLLWILHGERLHGWLRAFCARKGVAVGVLTVMFISSGIGAVFGLGYYWLLRKSKVHVAVLMAHEDSDHTAKDKEPSSPASHPTGDNSTGDKGTATPPAANHLDKPKDGKFQPLTRKDLDEALSKFRPSGMQPGLRSLLIPAQDPIPPNACDQMHSNDDSPDMKLAIVGPEVTEYRPRSTPFALVNFGGEDVLQIESAPGGIVLNATLRDETGQLVQTITKNVLHQYAPNNYQVTSDDHSVLILNSKDEIVLYVKYLNAKAVKVLGMFGSPNHGTLIIEEGSIRHNGLGINLQVGICNLNRAPDGSPFQLKAALVVP